MQKITSLVLTTTAGLQMDTLRAGGSVVKWTRSRRTRTESFRFEEHFWLKTRGIKSTIRVLDQIHIMYLWLLFQRVTSRNKCHFSLKGKKGGIFMNSVYGTHSFQLHNKKNLAKEFVMRRTLKLA